LKVGMANTTVSTLASDELPPPLDPPLLPELLPPLLLPPPLLLLQAAIMDNTRINDTSNFRNPFFLIVLPPGFIVEPPAKHQVALASP
jgi:hypothetical protein